MRACKLEISLPREIIKGSYLPGGARREGESDRSISFICFLKVWLVNTRIVFICCAAVGEFADNASDQPPNVILLGRARI